MGEATLPGVPISIGIQDYSPFLSRAFAELAEGKGARGMVVPTSRDSSILLVSTTGSLTE